MKTALRALAVTSLALWSTSASAKSETIRLEIAGPGLAQPLEITDRTILHSFSFWNGPGVSVNGEPVHLTPESLESQGAFIEWPRGQLEEAPAGLPTYEVTFHQRASGKHARYVIRYAFDPAKEGGYVYLPGPRDGAVYRDNVFSIYHGVEGNWFHSSRAWERLVRPLITSAPAASR